MKQAPGCVSLSLDPFSLFQDGLAAPEVYIGRGEVRQALVVLSVVVMLDEGVGSLPEIAGQDVVLQQDAVLQGLVPALDLALGLRVIWGTADLIHLPVFQPIGQLARDVTRPDVTEQAGHVQTRLPSVSVGRCCTNPGLTAGPFPRTDLLYGHCDRYTESSVAVQNGDTNLQFGGLAFEVFCHQGLAERLDAVHLQLDPATAVISAQPPPDGAAEIL